MVPPTHLVPVLTPPGRRLVVPTSLCANWIARLSFLCFGSAVLLLSLSLREHWPRITYWCHLLAVAYLWYGREALVGLNLVAERNAVWRHSAERALASRDLG